MVDEAVEEIKVGYFALSYTIFFDTPVEHYSPKSNENPKATPGRIAESIEEAIEEAVEEVVETIEEVVAIPGKKLEEIGISLPKYDIDLTVKTPAPPSKTLPPPPPPVQPKSSLFPPADQKLELPSFSFPTILDEPKKTAPPPPMKQSPPTVVPPTPQFPAVELPKIALPKVTIPELPKPTVTAPPKAVVTPKQPAPKEQKKDNYMFTEAALKEFIQKDKPTVTELDKQQEEERRAREARDAEISRAAEAAIAAFKGESAAPKAPVKPVTTAKTVLPKETPISVPPVKGRPTFSLFGLGGGAPKTETSVTTTTVSAPPKAKSPTLTVAKTTTTTTSAAPRGVPTISKWKIDPSDNSISGIISGSSAFKDGEPVTTSAVVGQVASNTVVKTKSGSR